jgi:PAS domain S-box-containing protein
MADERILVVDDEVHITQLCVHMLSNLGYRAQGTTSGREALVCLKTESFDLLLLDIKMPGIDGLTVLHRARELDPTLGAIIITGYATLDSTIEALKSGAEGVILKPFGFDELASAVEIAMTRRRREQERIRLQAQVPILEISQALMAEGDVEDLSRQLLEVIVRQIGADQASLLLLDEEADELYIAGASGLPADTTVGTRIPAEQSTTAWVLSQENPLVLDEQSQAAWDPSLQALILRPETNSIVCLPLRARTTIGLLCLGRLAGRAPFASADVHLLQIMAGQVAMALENARLYEQLQTRSRFLETLQAINATLRSTLPLREVLDTITHGTGKALGYRGCLILLPDEKNERLIMGGVWGGRFLDAASRITGGDLGRFSLPLKAKDNPMARSYLKNEFLSWSEKSEWIVTGVEPSIPSALAPAIAQAMGAESASCVPLTVGDKVVGVLTVLSPRTQLSAEERVVLLSLADQAGLAIQNAQLYQAAQHELAERKQAEEALRNERDRAQQYLDIAGVILVALDEKGEITLMNRKGHALLDYGEGKLVGKNWFDTCLPADVREEVRRVYHRLLAGEIEPVAYYENPVVTRAGEVRMIAWHNTVLTDEAGNITGTLSSGADITERRPAEEAL